VIGPQTEVFALRAAGSIATEIRLLETSDAAKTSSLTSALVRIFSLLVVLVAVGIASVEARTAFYARIATRIWENNPYPPQTILDALAESSKVSPTVACASGSAVDRAAIALRALDDAIAGHSDLAASSAFPITMQAIDDGLACRPLAAQLWLGRFWVHALSEGFRPPLRDSFDRSIATAPYDGWVMRLRAQIGSRWFYTLSDNEQQKFFEDLRYTVDMGYLDDALTAVGWLRNQPNRLKHEIDQWPLGTRDRFAGFLLSKGIDLKLATDFQLKPWQHY
jgi:hypothetical protein